MRHYLVRYLFFQGVTTLSSLSGVWALSEQELGRALPGNQCVYLAAFPAQGVCGKVPPAIISLERDEGYGEVKRYRYLYSQAISGLCILN